MVNTGPRREIFRTMRPLRTLQKFLACDANKSWFTIISTKYLNKSAEKNINKVNIILEDIYTQYGFPIIWVEEDGGLVIWVFPLHATPQQLNYFWPSGLNLHTFHELKPIDHWSLNLNYTVYYFGKKVNNMSVSFAIEGNQMLILDSWKHWQAEIG